MYLAAKSGVALGMITINPTFLHPNTIWTIISSNNIASEKQLQPPNQIPTGKREERTFHRKCVFKYARAKQESGHLQTAYWLNWRA